MSSTALRAWPVAELEAFVASQAGELLALRHELDETNRGVLALYAELDGKFRALCAKAYTGICLLDAGGRIIDANPALLSLLRRDMPGVMGRRIGDFVAPDWAGDLASPMSSAWHAEFPLIDAVGARVYVEWSISPFVEEGVSMAMATDVSERVLNRFSQGDSASTRTRGGLGLGLSIVNHLVTLHGGTIVTISRGAGFGARFDVRFPMLQPPAAAISPQAFDAAFVDDLPADLLAGLRILVVDDDQDALANLEIVLADRGARVEVANDFDSGLAKLESFGPDLLLSDIGMPGKDGHALMRHLRRSDGPGKHVPAIALTSFSRQQDVALALAAGFDAHCAKPLRPLELLRVIARVAHLDRRPRAGPPIGMD